MFWVICRSQPEAHGEQFILFNMQNTVAKVVYGDLPSECKRHKCGATHPFTLTPRASQLPPVLVVHIMKGATHLFGHAHNTTNHQATHAPDMQTSLQVTLFDTTYVLSVVHCCTDAHHVVYFSSPALHETKAPAGWYFYDDLGGKLWYIGRQLKMWHDPRTIDTLLYRRQI